MAKFDPARDIEGEKNFLLGNMAIVRGIIESGVKVAAAYPGTPSSEILAGLSTVSKKLGIHAEWSVNEKVALEVAIGASYTGVRSLAVMKHVGVNVAMDALMTLAYTGVNGGLVIISADDPSAHSSQNEQDNRHLARFAKIFCIEPYDPQSAKDYIKKAYDISEKFRIPVMLRTTTRINHAKGDVELGEMPGLKGEAKFQKDPRQYVCVPAHARLLHVALNSKLKEMEEYSSNSDLNSKEIMGKKGIITSGVSINYVRESVRELDIQPSILELGMTSPFPRNLVSDFLDKVDEVLVVEELEPFMEEQVRALAQGKTVRGKDLLPRQFEFDVNIVRKAIATFYGRDYDESISKSSMPLPIRPPVLCPGCSHRGVYYAMKKATRKKIYTGDIGCYTLGALDPLKAMDTCLCMGAGISQGAGMYHAGSKEHIISIIGDSTFFHGGLPGLMNAAYNKARMTVLILDNRITAMTGHQPNPGMGYTITGEETLEIDLEELVKALGAGYVAKVNPYELEETREALEKAMDFQGLSVVIAQEPCALMGKKLGLWKDPYQVERDKCHGFVCQGCRACIKLLACPAITWNAGRAEIVEELCTGCGVCAQVCPNEAIIQVKKNEE